MNRLKTGNYCNFILLGGLTVSASVHLSLETEVLFITIYKASFLSNERKAVLFFFFFGISNEYMPTK